MEDLDLLTIRSEGSAARVLVPLTERDQSFWEGTNYVLALIALIIIGVVWRTRKQNEEPMELLLESPTAPQSSDEQEAAGAA